MPLTNEQRNARKVAIGNLKKVLKQANKKILPILNQFIQKLETAPSDQSVANFAMRVLRALIDLRSDALGRFLTNQIDDFIQFFPNAFYDVNLAADGMAEEVLADFTAMTEYSILKYAMLWEQCALMEVINPVLARVYRAYLHCNTVKFDKKINVFTNPHLRASVQLTQRRSLSSTDLAKELDFLCSFDINNMVFFTQPNLNFIRYCLHQLSQSELVAEVEFVECIHSIQRGTTIAFLFLTNIVAPYIPFPTHDGEKFHENDVPIARMIDVNRLGVSTEEQNIILMLLAKLKNGSKILGSLVNSRITSEMIDHIVARMASSQEIIYLLNPNSTHTAMILEENFRKRLITAQNMDETVEDPFDNNAESTLCIRLLENVFKKPQLIPTLKASGIIEILQFNYQSQQLSNKLDVLWEKIRLESYELYEVLLLGIPNIANAHCYVINVIQNAAHDYSSKATLSDTQNLQLSGLFNVLNDVRATLVSVSSQDLTDFIHQILLIDDNFLAYLMTSKYIPLLKKFCPGFLYLVPATDRFNPEAPPDVTTLKPLALRYIRLLSQHTELYHEAYSNYFILRDLGLHNLPEVYRVEAMQVIEELRIYAGSERIIRLLSRSRENYTVDDFLYEMFRNTFKFLKNTSATSDATYLKYKSTILNKLGVSEVDVLNLPLSRFIAMPAPNQGGAFIADIIVSNPAHIKNLIETFARDIFVDFYFSITKFGWCYKRKSSKHFVAAVLNDMLLDKSLEKYLGESNKKLLLGLDILEPTPDEESLKDAVAAKLASCPNGQQIKTIISAEKPNTIDIQDELLLIINNMPQNIEVSMNISSFIAEPEQSEIKLKEKLLLEFYCSEHGEVQNIYARIQTFIPSCSLVEDGERSLMRLSLADCANDDLWPVILLSLYKNPQEIYKLMSSDPTKYDLFDNTNVCVLFAQKDYLNTIIYSNTQVPTTLGLVILERANTNSAFRESIFNDEVTLQTFINPISANEEINTRFATCLYDYAKRKSEIDLSLFVDFPPFFDVLPFDIMLKNTFSKFKSTFKVAVSAELEKSAEEACAAIKYDPDKGYVCRRTLWQKLNIYSSLLGVAGFTLFFIEEWHDLMPPYQFNTLMFGNVDDIMSEAALYHILMQSLTSADLQQDIIKSTLLRDRRNSFYKLEPFLKMRQIDIKHFQDSVTKTFRNLTGGPEMLSFQGLTAFPYTLDQFRTELYQRLLLNDDPIYNELEKVLATLTTIQRNINSKPDLQLLDLFILILFNVNYVPEYEQILASPSILPVLLDAEALDHLFDYFKMPNLTLYARLKYYKKNNLVSMGEYNLNDRGLSIFSINVFRALLEYPSLIKLLAKRPQYCGMLTLYMLPLTEASALIAQLHQTLSKSKAGRIIIQNNKPLCDHDAKQEYLAKKQQPNTENNKNSQPALCRASELCNFLQDIKTENITEIKVDDTNVPHSYVVTISATTSAALNKIKEAIQFYGNGILNKGKKSKKRKANAQLPFVIVAVPTNSLRTVTISISASIYNWTHKIYQNGMFKDRATAQKVSTNPVTSFVETLPSFCEIETEAEQEAWKNAIAASVAGAQEVKAGIIYHAKSQNKKAHFLITFPTVAWTVRESQSSTNYYILNQVVGNDILEREIINRLEKLCFNEREAYIVYNKSSKQVEVYPRTLNPTYPSQVHETVFDEMNKQVGMSKMLPPIIDLNTAESLDAWRNGIVMLFAGAAEIRTGINYIPRRGEEHPHLLVNLPLTCWTIFSGLNDGSSFRLNKSINETILQELVLLIQAYLKVSQARIDLLQPEPGAFQLRIYPRCVAINVADAMQTLIFEKLRLSCGIQKIEKQTITRCDHVMTESDVQDYLSRICKGVITNASFNFLLQLNKPVTPPAKQKTKKLAKKERGKADKPVYKLVFQYYIDRSKYALHAELPTEAILEILCHLLNTYLQAGAASFNKTTNRFIIHTNYFSAQQMNDILVMIQNDFATQLTNLLKAHVAKTNSHLVKSKQELEDSQFTQGLINSLKDSLFQAENESERIEILSVIQQLESERTVNLPNERFPFSFNLTPLDRRHINCYARLMLKHITPVNDPQVQLINEVIFDLACDRLMDHLSENLKKQSTSSIDQLYLYALRTIRRHLPNRIIREKDFAAFTPFIECLINNPPNNQDFGLNTTIKHHYNITMPVLSPVYRTMDHLPHISTGVQYSTYAEASKDERLQKHPELAELLRALLLNLVPAFPQKTLHWYYAIAGIVNRMGIDLRTTVFGYGFAKLGHTEGQDLFSSFCPSFINSILKQLRDYFDIQPSEDKSSTPARR